MDRVLIIDDRPSICDQYAYDLRRLGEFEVLTANSGDKGLAIIEREPIDCIILDLEMPGMDGFEVLNILRQQEEIIPVIVYTGTGSYERCTRAIRLGAYSFIDKAESMERVVGEIVNALEKNRLTVEVAALRERVGDSSPMIGESPVMEILKSDIDRLAGIPRPVLILGESGSGKDLVARELHRLSGRIENRYLPINCAAISKTLIESELFGHEANAFTGAKRMQKGAFEAVTGGTLFLDEIAEMPLEMQAVFLRVLEESKITRVRGTRQIAIDTRVIAATNRNLAEEVSAGRFRKDLFFRLNVHVVKVPPLRERLLDVPLLAEYFLGRIAGEYRRRPMSFSDDALKALVDYDWRQNNVRELRNAIERIVSICREDVISADQVRIELKTGRMRFASVIDSDIIEENDSGKATEEDRVAWQTVFGLSESDIPQTLKDRKATAERVIIRSALSRNNGQIGKTAEELGLADHSSLLKIMRRLGIR